MRESVAVTPPAARAGAVLWRRGASTRVTHDDTTPWWLGEALTVGSQGLTLDGVPLASVVARHGTPLYVYGATTVRRRLAQLRDALGTTGIPYRIHYAMKANRFPPLLALVRAEGDVAIDACSPSEVSAALASGFRPDEISVTASMLSRRDLAVFAEQRPHLNLDTRSALRRWCETPGHAPRVGLRIDPGVAVGWGDEPKLRYGNSKFGLDSEALLDTVADAQSLGLEVDTLHVHVGWGLQTNAAPLLAQVYDRLAAWARQIPTLRVLNVGGGLCSQQRPEDRPLPLQLWARLLRDHLGPVCRDRGLTIACEPGTFVVAAAGVLVAEINTIETRASGTWVGLDTGHNANMYAAHYGIPLAIVPVHRPLDPPAGPVHVAGNLNEANDMFARDLQLPALGEGDLVALWPAGAYGAAMASNHCMRGLPTEVLI